MFNCQWDTGGQERYATMTQSYYRQSDCIVCVYDVSDSQSFEDVPRWWKELDRYSKGMVPRVLVGNKIDLERMIETSQGEVVGKCLTDKKGTCKRIRSSFVHRD